MGKKLYLVGYSLGISFFLWFLMPVHALAVCPVCTIAVAAGVGLSRYLGIDDLISGVWIGGLILSSSFWLSSFLKNRKIKFLGQNFIVGLLMYALVVLPLWFGGIIGHPFNQIWGLDRLLVGVGFGSAVFLLSVFLDRLVRQRLGHQLFNYQKVVFPFASLIILSLIFNQLFSVK